MKETRYLLVTTWLLVFDTTIFFSSMMHIVTFLYCKILCRNLLHCCYLLLLVLMRGFCKSSVNSTLHLMNCIASQKLMLLCSAVSLGQSEAVTLTTHPCPPRPTSTTSGPMTGSTWALHLVYPKEKVTFRKQAALRSYGRFKNCMSDNILYFVIFR